jgi:hypothetical protein
MSVTEDQVARRLVLACGAAVPEVPGPVERVSSRPGKDEVDPLLSANPAAVIVVGTDADLAAVVLRLLRKGKLAETPVGFVPAGPGSAVARRWHLPVDPARALAVAFEGEAAAVPLVRDDSGGVLVGMGRLEAVDGVAYCDDTVAFRGKVRSVEVWPDQVAGLAVRVRSGLLARPRTFTARAFQLGCAPTRPAYDGVPHPRAVERWTWYRHTEDLRLIREPAQQR